jgi:3-oxoacyl-[acyl-carrier protein] reductase
MSRLEGKVALVTGASKGIGAGIAKGLAAAGASVAVNYASDRSSAEAVVAAITAAGGRAIVVPGDVSKSADVARLFVETKAAYGALDVLVNNAAVYQFGPLEAMTEEEFHREFNTNVLGPLLMIREAVKYFGPRGGSIINIGSMGVSIDPAQPVDLHGNQECPRCNHTGARKGVGAETDSSEFHQPWGNGNRGRSRGRRDRSRE